MSVRLGLWLALVLMWVKPAEAHLTPTSVIELEFGTSEVHALIDIPQSEISYALGKKMLSAGEIAAHIRVTSPDGRPWRVAVAAPHVALTQGTPDLVTSAVFTPPPGAPVRQFTLAYDALIDRLSSHIVLVMAKSDFAGGVLRSDPAMLGALQQGATKIAIDRGQGSGWRGFFASLRLGMHHIAGGVDHLMFLLTLLLPAPLLAFGGRWTEAAGLRATIRRLIGIVTAFTIGHSLTLIGGAFFGWRLPIQPVEVGIAISILVSAVHAFRPLFPGREALVAGGFGTIHGLAFASVLADFALPPFARAQAILGFNLGIEIVQIAIVAVVIPLLVWGARRSGYRQVRVAGAILSALAALYWIITRLSLV